MDTLFYSPALTKACSHLTALQTFRNGGTSPAPWNSLNFGDNTGDNPGRLRQNKAILCNKLGISPRMLATAGQVHGTTISLARTPGHYEECDALITDTAGIFLCIQTADCFPLVIHDPVSRSVGVAHAGWKGSAGKIAAATVRELGTHFGAEAHNCFAWIGAGISGAAYEVSSEVAVRFPKECSSPTPDGRFMLDLAAVNWLQLSDAGIPNQNIESSPYCTFRDNEQFFSHRRDSGKTGRMLTIAGVTPP